MDRYENLSPEKYLGIIRPYLRDLINNHKPTANLNNSNNANNNDAMRREWKVQLVTQSNFISVKNFEDTRTIHSASKLVEILMGSDTNDTIDSLFDTTLERFQQAIVTSQQNGSEFTHESVGLLYYYFQKINRKAESYIKSPDWIASKAATVNPKNEKDNKCFQWSVTAGLNYNKIKRKYFQHIKKWLMQIFHHTKETGKNLNKTILQLLLMSYLYHTIVKK